MPAAVAVPAVIAAVGGTVSAVMGNKAAKAQEQSARDATDAQLKMSRESIEFQREMADRARADQADWLNMGKNKLAELGQRTAAGGDLSRSFGMSDFQTDPGYQFRMAEGMKGMTNSAAARGGLLSGAALKAASNYNQMGASAEYGNAYNRFQTSQTNQFNRLASLANVGQVAANQNAGNAMQLGQSVGNNMMMTGQQMGNNLIGAGNARASGYMAQGNALVNGINQGVSAWNQYQQNKPPTAGESGGTNGGGWF